MDQSGQSMLDQLLADGVVANSEAVLTPLTGGVSSEIYLVTDQDRQFVVKRALEKLKVKADWFADVSRNESEYDYIDYVSKFSPENVPRVVAKGEGYFAMEYLGEGFDNWKQLLLDGVFDPAHAQSAGAFLAKVHRTSAEKSDVAQHFNYRKNFWDLRLDAYLVATGKRHAELRSLFFEEANRLNEAGGCLVHGDFSPKNILISGSRLVVLDCEVANYGDPVFDYCFLLNHLLLKTLWHSSGGSGLHPLVTGFSDAYYEGMAMTGEVAGIFSERGGRLLAMLLLARVDGKSPVEYLTEESAKDFVRSFVASVLLAGSVMVEDLIEKWFAELH